MAYVWVIKKRFFVEGEPVSSTTLDVYEKRVFKGFRVFLRIELVDTQHVKSESNRVSSR